MNQFPRIVSKVSSSRSSSSSIGGHWRSDNKYLRLRTILILIGAFAHAHPAVVPRFGQPQSPQEGQEVGLRASSRHERASYNGVTQTKIVGMKNVWPDDERKARPGRPRPTGIFFQSKERARSAAYKSFGQIEPLFMLANKGYIMCQVWTILTIGIHGGSSH